MGFVPKTPSTKIFQKSDFSLSLTSFQRYFGLTCCFLHFIMAARKQTAHFDKSLSCFQCLTGFAESFFPYGSNYG